MKYTKKDLLDLIELLNKDVVKGAYVPYVTRDIVAIIQCLNEMDALDKYDLVEIIHETLNCISIK